jgi:hypothetical protein
MEGTETTKVNRTIDYIGENDCGLRGLCIKCPFVALVAFVDFVVPVENDINH